MRQKGREKAKGEEGLGAGSFLNREREDLSFNEEKALCLTHASRKRATILLVVIRQTGLHW